ncbi:LOW QUALITY PROTEIN: Receptor-type tyrosine-protein phosphatase epsilon, partial [Galemys pyrenaicus]
SVSGVAAVPAVPGAPGVSRSRPSQVPWEAAFSATVGRAASWPMWLPGPQTQSIRDPFRLLLARAGQGTASGTGPGPAATHSPGSRASAGGGAPAVGGDVRPELLWGAPGGSGRVLDVSGPLPCAEARGRRPPRGGCWPPSPNPLKPPGGCPQWVQEPLGHINVVSWLGLPHVLPSRHSEQALMSEQMRQPPSRPWLAKISASLQTHARHGVSQCESKPFYETGLNFLIKSRFHMEEAASPEGVGSTEGVGSCGSWTRGHLRKAHTPSRVPSPGPDGRWEGWEGVSVKRLLGKAANEEPQSWQKRGRSCGGAVGWLSAECSSAPWPPGPWSLAPGPWPMPLAPWPPNPGPGSHPTHSCERGADSGPRHLTQAVARVDRSPTCKLGRFSPGKQRRNSWPAGLSSRARRLLAGSFPGQGRTLPASPSRQTDGILPEPERPAGSAGNQHVWPWSNPRLDARWHASRWGSPGRASMRGEGRRGRRAWLSPEKPQPQAFRARSLSKAVSVNVAEHTGLHPPTPCAPHPRHCEREHVSCEPAQAPVVCARQRDGSAGRTLGDAWGSLGAPALGSGWGEEAEHRSLCREGRTGAWAGLWTEGEAHLGNRGTFVRVHWAPLCATRTAELGARREDRRGGSRRLGPGSRRLWSLGLGPAGWRLGGAAEGLPGERSGRVRARGRRERAAGGKSRVLGGAALWVARPWAMKCARRGPWSCGALWDVQRPAPFKALRCVCVSQGRLCATGTVQMSMGDLGGKQSRALTGQRQERASTLPGGQRLGLRPAAQAAPWPGSRLRSAASTRGHPQLWPLGLDAACLHARGQMSLPAPSPHPLVPKPLRPSLCPPRATLPRRATGSRGPSAEPGVAALDHRRTRQGRIPEAHWWGRAQQEASGGEGPSGRTSGASAGRLSRRWRSGCQEAVIPTPCTEYPAGAAVTPLAMPEKPGEPVLRTGGPQDTARSGARWPPRPPRSRPGPRGDFCPLPARVLRARPRARGTRGAHTGPPEGRRLCGEACPGGRQRAGRLGSRARPEHPQPWPLVARGCSEGSGVSLPLPRPGAWPEAREERGLPVPAAGPNRASPSHAPLLPAATAPTPPGAEGGPLPPAQPRRPSRLTLAGPTQPRLAQTLRPVEPGPAAPPVRIWSLSECRGPSWCAALPEPAPQPRAPVTQPQPTLLLASRAACDFWGSPLAGASRPARLAMEPFCPLLLAGFSFPLAGALNSNETTTASSNWTSTASGSLGSGVSPSTLAWLLLPVLLSLLLLLLAAYFFRFRKQRKAVVSAGDKKMPNGILEEQEQQRVMLLGRSPSGPKKYFPIPVAHLEEEIRVRSADDCKRFREEFNSLPSGHTQGTFELANKEENREKNRYPNILPNDHSRVILSQVDSTPCSDYINASYIDGYREKNKFIATQGPKQETVNDFWRMVWEQRSATIVMLTNLKERKEEKCYQYWPDQGCWTYGSVRVSVEDCMVLVDYTIRKFCVQSQLPDGCKAPRLVSQLHFTSWPDFGVPFTPIGMLKFLKKVKTLNPAHAGPIVVHCRCVRARQGADGEPPGPRSPAWQAPRPCPPPRAGTQAPSLSRSAGVGRTGTFIVIDAMMDMMHAEQKVDVFEFVSKIRNQRPQMVQTDVQYTFIYQALLEYYLYGDTELDVSSLEKHLQTLQGPATPFDKIGLEEEFRKLTNVRIMKENMRTGNLPANMKKARVVQIIPYDFNRVILSMKRGQEYTDYINASFIDGYRQKDYFIATQGPLAHTVEDFWRMVWEWRCHTIVMLTEVQEREQDKCCQYWPAEGAVTHGDITIELKSDTLSEAISVRDFLVTFSQPLARQEEQSRLVRQFHFHGWPEVGIPAEGKGMIDLIAAVQKQQQQTGNHPITVHCSAGAGRTGTFIALSNILERVKAEGLLDVFQAVKSLRLQRPHMVQTLVRGRARTRRSQAVSRRARAHLPEELGLGGRRERPGHGRRRHCHSKAEQYEFCYKVVQDFIDIFSDYANFK